MNRRIVAVWVLALVGLCAAIALWPNAPTLICFAITFGLFGSAIGYSALEVHLEHRRDRRDRVRTGPGNDPGGPLGHPGYTIAGDPTTHSSGTRLVEEPIKAWKRANVGVFPDGSAAFLGYAGAVYGAEATAQCRGGHRNGGHVAPDPKCSCGFYALKDRDEIGEPFGNSVVLEVELYGGVMVGERGYRAQKQRVLAVYASRDFYAEYCQYRENAIVGHVGTLASDQPSSTHRGTVGYVNPKTGQRLCALHAIRASQQDGAPIREHVRETPKPPDTGTEWHWVDEK